MQHSLQRTLASALLILGVHLAVPAQAAPDEQFFPLATYRVGAYASSGIPVWAGMIDYLRYINEVEGGINGVKLVWQECETEWTAEKGIECYERFKNGLNGAPVAVYQPNGAPAAYALADKAEADRIPLITLGYGRTEATDGRVFPYNFPVMLTFYSEASAFINYVAEREGGLDKLRGKKIATVYHDSAYGRETQGPLKLLAEKYGFENIQIPVADPGNEQASQWRQVRQLKPDWVFLRTWGVSTPVAIKTAARFGFPVERIVGDIWASSNEDVLPAGEAGKGYLALTPYPGGATFDIHQRIKEHILDKGKSDLKDPKSFGSVYYNSGLVNAAIAVEAIRTGQTRFGKRPLNGEEGRWGLEHLDLDDARLKEIGFLGLMQPLKLSCSDHEGGGAAKVQQWDGKQWNLLTDWVQADRQILRPLIDAKAAEYAQEKKVTARDCTAQQ
ncbi:branched-chain amino acid transport system substrate-binding protein [Pseudomonas sp. BIGb0408]|uniref:Branched-chain amino acid transport system substrate-binding protein n=1 Tax=Phytopseudomonas flavescens TaxID=29435 RepID=A0A7Z0BM43_9GAMM|nr:MULTISPECIES: ABC transporter substrate-binding protein [Pseudomonas]MCW2293332.1 branched-chain amino acid transport system substrate-binding protein [Pseudomonas sp. BIGb0408]NYH72097.1 branched-chain amino acid transport system substrate-binding protein [Pseudomonas flavescens]